MTEQAPRLLSRAGAHARRLVPILVAGLLLALALAACGPAATPPEPAAGVEPTALPGNPLTGTEWQLVSLRGNPLLQDTYISLTFEEDQLEGFAGCNYYGGGSDSGGYTVGPDGKLEISMLARTAMACLDPEGVMEQEDAYIEALTTAEAYRLEEDILSIRNAADGTVLGFERINEFAMDPATLPGTAWQLVSLDGQPLREGSTLTLAFHDGQCAGGEAGCRDYVVSYQADEEGLHFPSTAMIGPVCANQEFLRQEEQYTTLLGWTERFRFQDDRLELHTARGEVLTYEPLPEGARPELEGPTWSLLAFIKPSPAEGLPGSTPLPVDLVSRTAPTATFADGQVSGTAGCNQYGGNYSLDGAALTLGDLFQTERACLEPEGVMAQEQRYLDTLRQATVACVYGTRLWLETPEGRALVFAPNP